MQRVSPEYDLKSSHCNSPADLGLALFLVHQISIVQFSKLDLCVSLINLKITPLYSLYVP